MLNKIKETLIQSGIACYDPGVRIGKIKLAYAVAYDRGVSVQQGSKGKLGQRIFEIVILVPLERQSELDSFEKNVIRILSNIKNLKFTGETQTTTIEKEFEGSSKSLLFRQPIRQ